MKYLVILFTILLLSCATTKKFEQALQSWDGYTEKELVESWGPPDKFYESGGTRYLTWVDSGTAMLPGIKPTYNTTIINGVANTTAVGGTSPTMVNFFCEKTMTIENNKVVSWKWYGNNCKSK